MTNNGRINENQTSMKLQKDKIPFTQVANEVLISTTLSWKAKGIYAYLFSKPDGWEFSANRIKDEALDGRHTVLAALKELEKKGYLERKKLGNGRVEYYLKHSIQSPKSGLRVDDPKSENRTVQKPHSAETDTISNKESPSNIDKESNIPEASSGRLIEEVIKLFEEVNPACKFFYNRPPQRKASQQLIDEYGFEQVERVIKYLPKSNKITYLPTIMTPMQLWEKYQALKDGVERKGKQLSTKGRGLEI